MAAIAKVANDAAADCAQERVRAGHANRVRQWPMAVADRVGVEQWRDAGDGGQNNVQPHKAPPPL